MTARQAEAIQRARKLGVSRQTLLAVLTERSGVSAEMTLRTSQSSAQQEVHPRRVGTYARRPSKAGPSFAASRAQQLELHERPFKGVAAGQFGDGVVQVVEAEGCCPAVDLLHGGHESGGIALAAQGAQAAEVFLAKQGGHDDAACADGRQFAVHDQAGQATVAVGEGVDFADDEHGQKCASCAGRHAGQ